MFCFVWSRRFEHFIRRWRNVNDKSSIQSWTAKYSHITLALRFNLNWNRISIAFVYIMYETKIEWNVRLKNQSTCVHKMAAISKGSDCWNATIKPRARNCCFYIQLMYIDECVIAIYGRWLPIACCSHTALPIPISHFPFPLVESVAFILISDFSMHYSIIHEA